MISLKMNSSPPSDIRLDLKKNATQVIKLYIIYLFQERLVTLRQSALQILVQQHLCQQE